MGSLKVYVFQKGFVLARKKMEFGMNCSIAFQCSVLLDKIVGSVAALSPFKLSSMYIADKLLMSSVEVCYFLARGINAPSNSLY